jgi:hypothetical protein
MRATIVVFFCVTHYADGSAFENAFETWDDAEAYGESILKSGTLARYYTVVEREVTGMVRTIHVS